MLTNYPQGSDLTVLNTVYHNMKKDDVTGKWKKDHITVVYKDNKTGKKGHEVIYNPEYTFYQRKEDPGYNLFFTEEKDVTPITCRYTDIEKKIAELTNNMDFFYHNIDTGNRRANKQLHTLNTIVGSDIDIEDYYRFLFDLNYKNDACSITKAFFDIEVDTINMRGDFPEMGECPINAISFINEATNDLHVFLLRNKENPLIQEFEDSVNPELFKELQEFIIDTVGGNDKAKKFKADAFNFNFHFFDDELELIQNLFFLVNKLQPDFLLAWNMAFDMPYIIERLKVMGIDPADILSDPTFIEKYADYYVDERHRNDYEARGDFYNIASHTVYLDQLIHFASRRKNQSQFPNFRLDTAGSILAGVKKLDYSHITTQISKLPYLDYKTFVFYNIIDTVVQKCIEIKTGDVDYIFTKCLMNNTRYAKGHRQTYYLTNRAIKEFRKQGYIFGNNVNKYFAEKKEFEGAIVNNPKHNSDFAKYKQNGEVFDIAKNLDDYDYKSLYPSVARENNLAPNTIISKIIIPQKVHDKENLFYNKFYDRGGDFTEDLMSQNYIEFSNRWLGLANVTEMIEDLREYFEKDPFFNMVDIDDKNQNVYQPIMFVDKEKYKYSPIVYYNDDEKGVEYTIPECIDFSYYLNKMMLDQ
ncbi:MAG: DNA polymerase domain-containing protein [Candidatus Izemoplasmatales bacterium]|nr:DNA polymerase domain-containing protein [Candidatus Izemoplasmatales bacterium]